MKAKKKFGQNFLINDFYINSIIDAINVFSNDLIIEIGPGKGALTRKLKEKNAKLIAYEVDKDLSSILSKIEDNKTKIIYQDFLKVNEINESYEKLYIVGNLPYYITTPILEHIIEMDIDPEEIVIMVQKEVADRFLAEPHTKDYGYFTLYLKYYFNIEKIIDVPSTAFNPEPKVNSTVIKLKRRLNKPEIDIHKYQKFLKECFHQKRKKLKNNLNNYDWEIILKVLYEYNLDQDVRAEELSEDILINIFKKIN